MSVYLEGSDGSQIDPRFVTGMYRGPNPPGRSISEYTKLILGMGLYLYTDLFINSAKQVKQAGRSRLVLVDIGSGQEGFIGLNLRPSLTCLGEKEYLKWWSGVDSVDWQTRKHILAEKRNLSVLHKELQEIGVAIQYLGLTDAISEPHNTVLYQIDEDNSKVGLPKYSARNVAYTLSDKQTFSGFLEDHLGRLDNSIDLALGVHSLRYLPPSVFSQTIRDVSEALCPNARLVAYNIEPDYMAPNGFMRFPWQGYFEARAERIEFLSSLSPNLIIQISGSTSRLDLPVGLEPGIYDSVTSIILQKVA